MTGFWPLNHMREVFVKIEQPSPHSEGRREWFGCPDCWAKVRPGKARLTVDEHPTATDTTTTGGV